MVDDINDHIPSFTRRVYRTVMSEHYAIGASITSVSATDADIGSNARLMYSLRQEDREYFTIATVEATNTGVLKVHKVCSWMNTRYKASPSTQLDLCKAQFLIALQFGGFPSVFVHSICYSEVFSFKKLVPVHT